MHESTQHVGPITKARVDRMMEEAFPEIHRLMPEALRKQKTHALFVVDAAGLKPGADHVGDRSRHDELRALANGKPLVCVLPTTQLLHLLRNLEDELRPVVEALKAPREKGQIPVLLSLGEQVFGLMHVGVGAAPAGARVIRAEEGEPFAEAPLDFGKDAIRDPNDSEGFLLSLAGALKMFLAADLKDVRPDGRARIVAFKARARAALATDAAMRMTPRDPGEVLIEAFGGRALREDFLRRDGEALVEWIDKTLAANKVA